MSDFDSKRISIFTGHYGSGKTEIALNYVRQFKSKYKETALIDLDFVNPYFRSREARELLAGEGIKVIASTEELFDTDLPAFSPQISGALRNPEVRVIVDLGGDEAGARAAGRFRNHIFDDEYELLFVVNPFRPFTSGPAEIGEVVAGIEAACRLKVTALISNPNLMTETTLSDILAGHETVLETARAMGLPVRFMVSEGSFGERLKLEVGVPVLQITRMMLKPWEK